MSRCFTVFSLFLLGLTLTRPAEAEEPGWHFQQEFSRSDPQPGDHHGAAFDFDGTTVVVPSRSAATAVNAWSAAVFERTPNGWSTDIILPVEHPLVTRSTGKVAVLGSTAIVNGKIAGVEKSFVFIRDDTGWKLETELLLLTPNIYSSYGSRSAALDGSRLAIGTPTSQVSPGIDDPGGMVHVFDRQATGWEIQDPIWLEDGRWDDLFGNDVVLDGDTLVTTSPGFFNPAIDLYRWNGLDWHPESRIITPTKLSNLSVALHRDLLLIGLATSDSQPGGEVRIHQRNGGTWPWVQSIGSPSQLPNAEFGAAVDIDANRLIVGSPAEESASIFKLQGSTWVQEATLSSPRPQPGARFGSTVAIEGDTALVGAPWDSHHGNASGAIFLFSLGVPVGLGEPCEAGGECKTGFCNNGVCCNEACEEECRSCLASHKGSGEDGICGPVAVGTDPKGDCEASTEPYSCLAPGTCGVSGCERFTPTAVPCGPTTCNEGAISGSICNGSGTCVDKSVAACFPYLCAGDRCGTECDDDSDCAPGAVCSLARTCQSVALCDGNHTIVTPTGLSIDCSPYRCLPDGTCGQMCASTVDCIDPNVCNRSYACVPLKEHDESKRGCGCSMPGTGDRLPKGVWFLALAPVAYVFRKLPTRRTFLLSIACLLTFGCSPANPPQDESPRKNDIETSIFLRDLQIGQAIWSEAVELTRANPFPGDQFGQAVSIDGNTLAVGAPGSGSGVVHIFERQGPDWAHSRKLESDIDGVSQLGLRLALRDNLLIASCKLGEEGAILSFTRTSEGWQSLGRIEGISASAIAIGEDARVYVGTGVEVHILSIEENALTKVEVLSSPSQEPAFGRSLAIQGNWLVVGAPGGSGSISFFRMSSTSGWIWEISLDVEGTSNFGAGLALDGVTAIVTQAASSSWTQAHAFSYNGSVWEHSDVLEPLPLFPKKFVSPMIASDRAIVGAPPDAAIVFLRSSAGWMQEVRLKSPPGAVDFGASLSYSPPFLLVGDPSAPLSGANAGSAYLFMLSNVGDRGDPCLTSNTCLSGYCVDGVCCDGPCSLPCLSCSASRKGTGMDGICGPTAMGTDPKNHCEKESGYPANCGGDGTCDGFGQCRVVAMEGTACGNTVCVEDAVSGSICNASGSCLVQGIVDCNPGICVDGSCILTCEFSADCSLGAQCSSEGICVTTTVCEDDRFFLTSDGERGDCAPYHCKPNGTCATFCNRVEDCVPPYVCTRDHECVPLNGFAESKRSSCSIGHYPTSRASFWGMAWTMLLMSFLWRRLGHSL